MANKTFIVLLGLTLLVAACAFTPNNCPANNNGIQVNCLQNIVPGCAIFKNSTSKYVTNGNRCTYCYYSNSQVVSFNENEKCPGNGEAVPLPTPVPSPAPTDFTPSKCPASNPALVNCLYSIVPGCAGFKNGTFAYLNGGNKCTYCNAAGSQIVSYNEGQKCPTLSTPVPLPTPQPNGFTAKKCPNTYGIQVNCLRNIVPGCAGFKNGTFAYLTAGNQCTYCNSNNQIASFNENEKCPTLSTPTPQPNGFTPSKCANTNGALVNCLFSIVPGCAGFKNGTYAYLTNGNKCTYCNAANSQVVSYNEGQKCPALSTPVPLPTPQPGKTFVPNRCPINNGAQVRCTMQITPGCACYANGTCEYLTNGNRCTQCYTTNSKVVSFNENEKCPTLSSGNNGNSGSSSVKFGLKFRFQAGVLHY